MALLFLSTLMCMKNNFKQATKIAVSSDLSHVTIPVLTTRVLKSVTAYDSVTASNISSENILTLSYMPIIIHSVFPCHRNAVLLIEW